jgi:hypothetical protein
MTGLAAHVTGTIVTKPSSTASTAATATTSSTSSSGLVPHRFHSNFLLAQLFGVSS